MKKENLRKECLKEQLPEIKKFKKEELRNREIKNLSLSREDLSREIVRRNLNLIDRYNYDKNPKNYKNMMNIMSEEAVYEEMSDVICFSPYELTSSYILSNLLGHSILNQYRIYRSSDVIDIAFGKSTTDGGPKTVNSIKVKLLFVIVDSLSNDYHQQILIQLLENRALMNLHTIIIFNIPSSEVDSQFPMLDAYLFDGIQPKDRFKLVELFVIKENRKTKKGIWK